MNPLKINSLNWSYSEMTIKLKKFVEIYRERPIKKNFRGMRFNNMFALYFILLKIKSLMQIYFTSSITIKEIKDFKQHQDIEVNLFKDYQSFLIIQQF